MSLCTYLLVKYIKKRTAGRRRIEGSSSETADLSPSADTLGNDIDDPVSSNSPMCIFEIIAASTDNFKDNNNLGEGGFSPVYKGRLSNGEEIAVMEKKFGENHKYLPAVTCIEIGRKPQILPGKAFNMYRNLEKKFYQHQHLEYTNP